MRKYSLNVLIATMLTLLIGCQSLNFNRYPSDRELTTAVNTAFMNNDLLATQPVHVEANQGTVFLSGYVKTIRQSDTAGALATRVPGVRAVQNNLIVRK